MEQKGQNEKNTINQQKTHISNFLPKNILDEIEIASHQNSFNEKDISIKQFPNAEDTISTLYSSDSGNEISNVNNNKKVVYSNANTTSYNNCNCNSLYISMHNKGDNEKFNQSMNSTSTRFIKVRMVYTDSFNNNSNNSNVNSRKVVSREVNLDSNYNYLLNKNITPQYPIINGCNRINYQGNINIYHKPSLIDKQIDSVISQMNFCISSNLSLSPLTAIFDQMSPIVFIKLMKTSKGSRYLQELISNSQPMQNEINFILKLITINLWDIFCDHYGNYFLQKFLPFCNLHQRLFLYKYIQPHFVTIANDICGNHSLQCLILLQNSKEEQEIIKQCVKNDLHSLSTGLNSSHVIQKIIKAIKEPNREYINSYIIDNIMQLCLNANGICVVKEFIINTKRENYIKAIVSVFEVEIKKLTLDQYGNFGIQEAINFYGERYCAKIIDSIIEDILEFSISKFSSKVIDFIIEFLFNYNISKFLFVMRKIFIDDVLVCEMIKSKYATYVIENCLNLLNDKDLFVNKDRVTILKLIDIRKKVYNKLAIVINAKDKKKIFKHLTSIK